MYLCFRGIVTREWEIMYMYVRGIVTRAGRSCICVLGVS